VCAHESMIRNEIINIAILNTLLMPVRDPLPSFPTNPNPENDQYVNYRSLTFQEFHSAGTLLSDSFHTVYIVLWRPVHGHACIDCFVPFPCIAWTYQIYPTTCWRTLGCLQFGSLGTKLLWTLIRKHFYMYVCTHFYFSILKWNNWEVSYLTF
jgi:hypothetical protein